MSFSISAPFPQENDAAIAKEEYSKARVQRRQKSPRKRPFPRLYNPRTNFVLSGYLKQQKMSMANMVAEKTGNPTVGHDRPTTLLESLDDEDGHADVDDGADDFGLDVKQRKSLPADYGSLALRRGALNEIAVQEERTLVREDFK
jgi:hypothetical protein